MSRQLLDLLTENIDAISHNIEDPVADALEKALKNTRPDHAGTPWEDGVEKPKDSEIELRNKLFDRITGRG